MKIEVEGEIPRLSTAPKRKISFGSVIKKEPIRFFLILLLPLLLAALWNIIPFEPSWGSEIVEPNQLWAPISVLIAVLKLTGIDFVAAVLCATRHQAYKALGLARILFSIAVAAFLEMSITYISSYDLPSVCLFSTIHFSLALPIIFMRFR